MAQTPEAKAKAAVKKLLDACGCYYITPATGGFGKSGAPDFVGCVAGWFFGCEVKADTDLTELQRDNLRRIESSGGRAFVVRVTKKQSYGLHNFAEFLGVHHNETTQLQENGCLAKDDFRSEKAVRMEPRAADGGGSPTVVGGTRTVVRKKKAAQ